MTEWTITVDSPAGTARGEHDLEAFAEALEQHPAALGPAASMDTKDMSLGATFTVDAPDKEEAALRGCLAYWRAIADAGLELEHDSTVDVAPADHDDQAERFRFAFDRVA